MQYKPPIMLLRDNKYGISDGTFRRAIDSTGSFRISKEVYDSLRDLLYDMIKTSLSPVVKLTINSGKKTLQADTLGKSHTIQCSDAKIFQKLPFARLTKEVIQQLGMRDFRISREFIDVFRQFMTKNLINIGLTLKESAESNNRKTILVRDVESARKTLG